MLTPIVRCASNLIELSNLRGVPLGHLLDFMSSLVFMLVIPSRCETMGDFDMISKKLPINLVVSEYLLIFAVYNSLMIESIVMMRLISSNIIVK